MNLFLLIAASIALGAILGCIVALLVCGDLEAAASVAAD